MSKSRPGGGSGQRGEEQAAGNGHVAQLATEIGADLIVDTDCHAPEDLITFKQAYNIARGAGLNDAQAMNALIEYPRKILNKRL